MQNNMSRIVSFIVLLAFIVVIGALFYKVMIGFLVPVFLAAVLVVVFRPLHRWVFEKVGEREHLAAAITTAIILFLVLLPAGIVATTGAIQGAGLVKNFNANNIDVTLERVRSYFKLEMAHGDYLKNIQMEVEDLQTIVHEEDYTKLYNKNERFGSHVKQLREKLEAFKRSMQSDESKKSTKEENNSKTPVAGEPDEPTFFAQQEFAALEKSMNEVDPSVFESMETKPDIIEIQTLAVQLDNNWQKLKEKILGGPTRAIWIDLANPTDRDMKSFRNGLTKFLQPRLVELTSMTSMMIIRLVVGCAILSLSLFFFLYDGPRMMRGIMQLSPLDDRYEQELLMEFDRTARAVVLATILSAVVQGLIAGLGYYAVGMPSLILLILLTTACALVPFVGPALVWVPVCLYLLIYRENTFAAGGLALWGVFVVGTSDNFVKMFVLHGQRQLHPLLALLSVLGGVQSLGPIGILVGPMAVTMLQTLLGILQHELTQFDSKWAERKTLAPRDRLRKRVKRKNGEASPQPGDVAATEDPPVDGPPST